MTNNLPNPIPAGSRIHIYVGNGFQRTHVLTAPLHHLTPEMVEAVRKAIYRLRLESSMWADVLEHAFAHHLTPPVAKEPTVRERIDTSTSGMSEPLRIVLGNLADAIDALAKEVRNGR